jgi:hypothetical protein
MPLKFLKLQDRLLKKGAQNLYLNAAKNKKRLKFAEPVIAKVPHWAYMYAMDVIKGPWPEAEPYIMKNAYWAYMYARVILKQRWPEAEPYIKNGDIRSWGYYKDYFNIKD